jgi:hypothetical protein
MKDSWKSQDGNYKQYNFSGIHRRFVRGQPNVWEKFIASIFSIGFEDVRDI